MKKNFKRERKLREMKREKNGNKKPQTRKIKSINSSEISWFEVGNGRVKE